MSSIHHLELSAVVSQVDQLLRWELLPAQGTFCLGVAPLGDTLPAEEMAARCGRGVSSFLQA